MDLSAEPNLDDDHLSAYRFVRFVENACAETASLKVPVITRLAETLRDKHALTALLDQWQKPWPGALRRCVREVMRENCRGEPQCFQAALPPSTPHASGSSRAKGMTHSSGI